MNSGKINRIREKVKTTNPLIHCITNPISINQCANAVLAVGARPIMAEHPKEVCGITATSAALVINLGNITDVRISSISISAQQANEQQIPFIIDVVGASCSELRRAFALNIINQFRPDVIKGNYSEINAIYNNNYISAGVDADTALTAEYMAEISKKLAEKYNTTILASGKIDIVADSQKVYFISNGTGQLANITGTGCMLGVLCGTFISVTDSLSAAVTACVVQGICGELSATEKGNGTFMVNLMDNLSVLKNTEVEQFIKIKEV